MVKHKRVRFALPKGSLQLDTLNLLRKAGYQISGYDINSRNYRPTTDDSELELKVLRPQEIPMYVEEGIYDIGITGFDWLLENSGAHRAHSPQDSQVLDLLDLKYGKVELVLAVPNSWDKIKSFDDLLDFYKNRMIRIATEFLNISTRYIVEKTGLEPSEISPWRPRRRLHTSRICLILSFGATEGKPPEDAEAIIDLASPQARTIKANNLKIIDSVLHSLRFPRYSTARLIANKNSLEDPSKSEKIQQVKDRLARAVKNRDGRSQTEIGLDNIEGKIGGLLSK